jgi:hypothetical protein
MADAERQFRLPSRVDSYLATLNRVYEQADKMLLREIVVNGLVSIHEGSDYDGWNGGIYGHAITLTVSEDLFLRAIDAREDFQARIAEDLNKLNNSRNEHISEVFIEMSPSDRDRWREKSGVYRPPMPSHAVPADALARIWGSHRIRVFLSHKANVKVETSLLKQALARCGIAAFVAHDDIEPTQEWLREIERALFSMDALVALLTPDFHDSNWTDQEVGVAIGRGVPLIPVRLGSDPYGLMGKGQGLGGCSWSDTSSIAKKVFDLLYKRLADKSRMFECALAAYSDSATFADSAWKVEHLLSVLSDLSSNQIDRLLDAYGANDQNKYSFKGRDLLRPLLERWTGKEWTVTKNGLAILKDANTKPIF